MDQPNTFNKKKLYFCLKQNVSISGSDMVLPIKESASSNCLYFRIILSILN